MDKRFVVFSPKFDKVEPVLDYGEGPTVTSWLETEVTATSKRKAILLAVKEWRKKYGKRGLPYCEIDENPYSGVTVVPWAEVYELGGA